MAGQIRVLITDDSAFMRHTIARLLLAESDIEVVGSARDGMDALAKIKELRPDVVTLDVEMPRLDGLATLERIMQECPCPVVMLSGVTQEGARVTLRSLELGAIDFVAKPSGQISLGLDKVKVELLSKIRTAARASLSRAARPLPQPAADGSRKGEVFARGGFRKVVVIGSSTGGPKALHEVISRLPGDLAAALLLVQHMPKGFTKSLAERLDGISALKVKEAEPGDVLRPGMALLARGDFHLRLDGSGEAKLERSPPLHGVRPAVDVTLEAAAKHYQDRSLGVILTGMGTDGTWGAGLIKAAGGQIIAEDESSCVVYGMPRSVIEKGYADRIVPLRRIPEEIVAHCG